jgi:hypothetical protein
MAFCHFGEMLAEQKRTVGLNQGAKGSSVTGAARVSVKDPRPTLADVGPSLNQALKGFNVSAHEKSAIVKADRDPAIVAALDKLRRFDLAASSRLSRREFERST